MIENKTQMAAADLHLATNPDIRGSLAAMKRAAAMARKIAMQTDTGIVIVKDGSIVRVSAEELRRESKQA